MAASPSSLRYVINKAILDFKEPGGMMQPIRSNLEKAGRAMRYAMSPVQYYSSRYPYGEELVKGNDRSVVRQFGGNPLTIAE